MTEVFFDFLCPYAWRGVELAAVLRGQGEPFRLRFYSLVEGNHPDNAKELNWKLTDQPTDQPTDAEGGEGYMSYQRPSLGAFLAAQAASQQGEEKAWAFTLALYRAHHEQKKELNEDTFVQAARDAGVDLTRWTKDRADETGLRAALRREFDDAREIGVFGTPTFVLPGGEAAYYRFENLTRDPQAAREHWTLFQNVLHSDAGIGTIKRAKNRPPRKQ